MLILAVAVVAVRAGSPGTVQAATGDIGVLNVGTCYTTDDDAFGVGDCDDGDGNADDLEGYEVAGRDSITEVDNVFATYAIDPKTSGDQPRAILKNADLIKISIDDKGRDKRTGKIYAVDTTTATAYLDPAMSETIVGALGDAADPLLEDDPADTDELLNVKLTSTDATFARIRSNDNGTINSSGDAQFRLQGGTESTEFPMAPDGDIYWFGTVNIAQAGAGATENLARYIDRDEDFSPGVEDSIAPWMRVTAALEANVEIVIQYIYYETSEYEEIVGGRKKDEYELTADDKDVSPVFEGDENAEGVADQDALILRVSSDGNNPTQNLHVKEDPNDRFSGIYEGYIRLTDADGDGSVEDNASTTDRDEAEDKDNWGLPTRDATGPGAEEYAVIGVESGPVTITYKDSNGDINTISITIDKDAPSIQVDSPIDGTASTDDSPELIGSFIDGGGSGLREESFKIYADNTPDSRKDLTPVWDLGVLGDLGDNPGNRVDRGHVCIDTDDEDSTSGYQECDPVASSASLRAQYFGYDDGHGTFGIVHSADIYFDPDATHTTLDEVHDRYKTADAEQFEDGDVEGEFDTIVRIDFPQSPEDDGRYNNIIDIQAVVIDIAGNIGFSDADPSAPTFIHDLGTAKDRDKDDKHNVLGWFSRHVYYLDDVNPYFQEDQSATGFFIDADGDESINNSGVMVVFDGPLDPATVGIGSFDVALDAPGGDATVVDAAVDGEKVYLLLEEELAPDSTPSVGLAAGQAISDLAGNESTERRLDGIELSDGILPTFLVTLSGGTGLNEDVDGEGPSELTKAGIKLSISANETIQGAPQFAVVCSNLLWDDDAEGTSPGKFASNRTGAFTTGEINAAGPDETKHTSDEAVASDDGEISDVQDHVSRWRRLGRRP